MTATQPERCDIHADPLTPVERRFAVELVDYDLPSSAVTMSMPVAGLANPFTGVPTLSPLAILVDAAAGRANHVRREADQWTVTSELTLELSPRGQSAATDDPYDHVVATAHTLGREGLTSLSLCTLTQGADVIGYGTVRSYFISADRVLAEHPGGPPRTSPSTLAELMAVGIQPAEEGVRVLMQEPNPAIYNAIGAVHGGVASAGLELLASAVINADSQHMPTASLRVNFLRPFMAGKHSHYVATPLRIGRTSAVADAQAIGEDSRVALVARVTSYR